MLNIIIGLNIGIFAGYIIGYIQLRRLQKIKDSMSVGHIEKLNGYIKTLEGDITRFRDFMKPTEPSSISDEKEYKILKARRMNENKDPMEDIDKEMLNKINGGL